MGKKYKYVKAFTFEGKRYYIRANTKKELAEKHAKKLAELEDGLRVITKKIHFRDWAAEWMETYKAPTVSITTYNIYKYTFDKHIFPNIGNMPLHLIRPVHCQRVMNELPGMSASTIDNVHKLMKNCLMDAKYNNLIQDNPAEHLKLPKPTKKRPRRILTQYEREILLLTADSHHYGLWVKLMLLCGLRPAEAAAVQWYQIDFKKGILHVDSAIKKEGNRGCTKTAAGVRDIPIREPFLAELKKRRGEPFDYVQKNLKGLHLTSQSMRTAWKRFFNDMNIVAGCSSRDGIALPPYRMADDLIPYMLRHSFCTELRDAGVDITVARALMGHTNISTTAQIYTHSTDQSIENARRLLEGCNTLSNTLQPALDL